MKRYNNLSVCLTLLACALAVLLPAEPAAAQEDVQFSGIEVESRFPEELVFRARAVSPGEEIVRAEFAYSTLNFYAPESYTVKAVEITPGEEVLLEYTLDTRDFTTPPMMSYLYRWELVLSDGTDFISKTYEVRYTDSRYDWQVLENDQVGVWWHDRPDDFGGKVFEIAATAVEMQQELFGAELENQLLVVINNNPEEFASWHLIAHDWVGGQTFSDFGITVQIVNDFDVASSWLYNVIPHEISHIFFNQVTYNPTVSIPVWLDEGVAQYNELVDHEWVYQQVEYAAAEGELIPLSSLARGFGAYNTERVYLAYYESLSAAAYLVDRYGSQGLSALLAAYKEGVSTEKAFEQALGISATRFELDWAAYLGAVEYTISTPWPSPTFRPSPTFGDASSQATPRPQDQGRDPGRNPLIPCLGPLPLLGLGAVWYRSRSKNRPGQER